jgi:hypothetical protein
MSHVFHYDGHYFRIQIAEVVGADKPDATEYASWCSDAFRELKEAPSKACSRFVAGSPFASRDEALRRAQDSIKANREAQQARRSLTPAGRPDVFYTVWLFKGDLSSEHQFQEFSDARLFAESAKKEAGITKVGIVNNESPQYLTVWEKGK